jgi:hypothetical protein
VRAASKLDKEDAVPAVTEKDDWRIKRLQMLARIQATVLSNAETDAVAKSQMTLKSVNNFFTQWQSYPFCYGDIKAYVDGLPSGAQKDFLEHVSASSLKLTDTDSEKSVKVRHLLPIPLELY